MTGRHDRYGELLDDDDVFGSDPTKKPGEPAEPVTDCEVCGQPLHPKLAVAGETTHVTCAPERAAA